MKERPVTAIWPMQPGANCFLCTWPYCELWMCIRALIPHYHPPGRCCYCPHVIDEELKHRHKLPQITLYCVPRGTQSSESLASASALNLSAHTDGPGPEEVTPAAGFGSPKSMRPFPMGNWGVDVSHLSLSHILTLKMLLS